MDVSCVSAAGPLFSALCNKYGSRKIAILGSVTSACFILFSPALSTDVRVFVVLFGLGGGRSHFRSQ